MKRIITTGIAALAALAGVQTAAAQSSREYFVAHAQREAAPRQLSGEEQELYANLFGAIDAGDWPTVQRLLPQSEGKLLHQVALAEFFLDARSPRVELPQIQAWLERGKALPQAAQMGRLGLARGASEMPDLPQERPFVSQQGIPKRVRPASIQDGTMPSGVAEQILDRITHDDPDGARLLLDGVDASLSPEARAEWRQRVAWSYYIENMDAAALAMAKTASAGSGPWVAEGEWVVGLAAWRLSDCVQAGSGFERAAFYATNPELRAAAYYWASRAALRCRQPERSAEFLGHAADADQTLYGMLAAEQLGRSLPDRVASAEFSGEDWAQLGGVDNVRIAIALAEIGRDELSSEVLLHQARIGDPSHYEALSRLARELGFPSTQLYMAYNVPSGGRADPASLFPAPRWVPATGWRVDPALAYAHTLQESNFRAGAVSPARAQGLMQITPITVREHAPRLGLDASHVDIFDPSVNLAFGQRNLEMLRDEAATGGTLPKVMAAYNAGLTPVTRWNEEINDQGDPLLWMESIPYWETRAYVAIVMRNYWMYQRQADAVSPTRISLAENAWPAFPDGGEATDGRVYLSAERR